MADSSKTETGKGQKVLIAIDGSKHSVYAFEWYAENMHRDTNDVTLCFCSEMGTHLSGSAAQSSPATLHALVEKHEGKAKEIFSQFGTMASKYNIEHKLERLHDPPKASIVKFAKENNMDVIIAGSRGHGMLKGAFLGSVSAYIVHHSHVPVIICKH